MMFSLNVIHVRVLINSSRNKTNKCPNVKIIFIHTTCHNSDMFRSILIIFREFNIIKAYIKSTDGLLNTLQFVHKMSADIINYDM